uniref:Uncharacterized protein n=1 Tax=Acrobeloides nanus TaxID=290746 RepID=A0A914DZY6_9BILA
MTTEMESVWDRCDCPRRLPCPGQKFCPECPQAPVVHACAIPKDNLTTPKPCLPFKSTTQAITTTTKQPKTTPEFDDIVEVINFSYPDDFNFSGTAEKQFFEICAEGNVIVIFTFAMVWVLLGIVSIHLGLTLWFAYMDRRIVPRTPYHIPVPPMFPGSAFVNPLVGARPSGTLATGATVQLPTAMVGPNVGPPPTAYTLAESVASTSAGGFEEIPLTTLPAVLEPSAQGHVSSTPSAIINLVRKNLRDSIGHTVFNGQLRRNARSDNLSSLANEIQN